MTVKRVYSQNADYQRFEVLKSNRSKRYHYRQFFVEGVRNINTALQNGWHICSFLYTPDKPLSDWAKGLLSSIHTDVNYELSGPLMAKLSGKSDTSELMAIAAMRPDTPDQLKLSENPLLMLFDRPSNRGNLGTMIRSCDALGADGLILTGHGVDLYDPEVVGASMGSFFNLPVIRLADNQSLFDYLNALKSRFPTFQTVGTTAHRQHPLYAAPLDGPLLLMVGNETEGLSRTFKESCDLLVTIPMAEQGAASSFNVACAASILLYETVRQRTVTAPSPPEAP